MIGQAAGGVRNVPGVPAARGYPYARTPPFRWRGTAAGLLLVLAPVAGIHAQQVRGIPLDPRKAITQYVHAVWRTEQGLPQNSVRAILQTRDGYLWLGTQEGLVRFDGARFLVFDKKNTPGLRHSFVWSLLEDREGSLWIGTVGGGLSRLQNGRFTAFTTAEGLSNDYVRALHQDREGTLWIGTDSGVDLFRNGKLTHLAVGHALPTEPIRAIEEDGQGAFWIGTDGGGLVRLEGDKATVFTTRQGLASDRVTSLLRDSAQRLWIGTLGGLNCFEAGALTRFLAKDGLSGELVVALFQDREGSLWVGTDGGGINRFREGRWSAFTAKDGFSNDSVAAITQDREGSLWVGTDGGGLNRFEDGKFTTFAAKEGLSNDLALSIQEDRAGSLWIGTHGGGLNRLRAAKLPADPAATPASFSVLTVRDGLPNDVVFSTLEDRAGRLWIGTDGGLGRLEAGKLSRLTTKDGLSSDRVRAILEDRHGVLWIGTDGGGVTCMEGRKLTPLTTKQGLSNDIVTSIYEDRDGAIWIATWGGLNRIVDGTITRFSTKDGLAHDFVFSTYQDADGVFWIGTFGGLSRLQDGKFTTYTTKEGLFDDLVAETLEDGQGNLWMSCNKGISRVSRLDLNRLAAGQLKTVTSIAYGAADGMRSSECNAGFQPASWRTRDGRLWFPTVRGAVVIDPQHILTNDIPPPVLVEDVLVDDHELPASPDPRLPPGKQRFEFHYTALSFRAPEKIRFKYKLEGQDKDWVDAGARRTAYYTNIPPGPHRFRVMACNEDGVWNESGASYAFSLAPRFYETWWFYLVSTGVLAAGLWGAYRARVRHLTEREAELLVLVDERTKDLRQAQEKISKLLESAPAASQSIAAWSRALAEDVAQSIGVERIGLWEVDKEILSPLSDSGLKPPSLEELRGLASVEGEGRKDGQERTMVPMRGTSGQLCGALVIAGRSLEWGDTERRLVAGLAHQLGGALEMSRMRRQLAAAEKRRAATRREMQEQGIATLQLCPSCGRCYDHTLTLCTEDGVALEAPRPLPYLLFDRYRLLRVLGQGGMGMVLGAHDQKLGRDVAIKLIRPEHFGEEDLKERFEREAQTVARIHHEGVIALHDSGELPDGTAFIVMERLEGCDLGLVLKTYGAGTPQQVAALVRQGCSALAAAHRAGVVHRDIKPENIFLVDAAGGFRVKLLDFGLAKSMSFEKGLTQTGVVVGTPKYMSPEQVRHEDVDPRSDVYSFACVCYEALSGRKAIAGDDLGRILIDVLNTLPPPISSLVPGVPPEVDAMLEFALAKDRSQRPTSIEAWGVALAELLDKATLAKATSAWPVSRDALTRLGELSAGNPRTRPTPVGGVERSSADTAERLKDERLG
jgi:ligand-binding sensor domain-containing protein/rRNA maturation protein Nop10